MKPLRTPNHYPLPTTHNLLPTTGSHLPLSSFFLLSSPSLIVLPPFISFFHLSPTLMSCFVVPSSDTTALTPCSSRVSFLTYARLLQSCGLSPPPLSTRKGCMPPPRSVNTIPATPRTCRRGGERGKEEERESKKTRGESDDGCCTIASSSSHRHIVPLPL